MTRRHETTLDHLIGSRVRARLLVALLKEPGRLPCFRELAREAGPGVSFVRRELAELERMGLVKHKRMNCTIVFDVVTCHPLYAPLRELIRVTERIDADGGLPGSRWRILPYEDREPTG